MSWVLLHTGQSGVERGADRAARALGLKVAGYSTFERRDEMGPLPTELAADLVPCPTRGARAALRGTMESAMAVVIAVPETATANRYAGIEALRRSCRKLAIPHWVVDPATDLDAVACDVRHSRPRDASLRVLVTGPRLTRWERGEAVGWRIVMELALESTLSRPMGAEITAGKSP
ncbi:MAG: putative molybdenum carrier protein [Kofleriaceae bacterium]